MNEMRTFFLLAAMTALFVFVGLALGGGRGAAAALVFAGVANAWTWFHSARSALSAVDAREVDAASAPDLVGDVAILAQRAGVPAPRVFVAPSAQPNAFATGRGPADACVCVNAGLLTLLPREERFGVLAHEIAHIRNRDTLTMTVTATLAGAISAITHWGFVLSGRRVGFLLGLLTSILASLAAAIVQMAISRDREYAADRLGAQLCGNPLWLAGALQRLAHASVPDEAVEARPAMAPMYIVNPLAGGARDNLFSTHPALENRLAALMRLAQEMGSGLAGAGAAHDAPFSPAPEPSRRWRPFRQGAPAAPSFLGGRGIAGREGPWR